MLLSIINYDYFTNKIGPILRLICRDKNNTRHIIDIQDKILTPHFYIKIDDLDSFIYESKARNMFHLIIQTSTGIDSALDEETVGIYTKYPWQVRKLRDMIPEMITFQADIKWEKMAIQTLKFKQFIEVDQINEYGITKLRHIHNTDNMFKLNQNICYWDIETNGSAVKVGWGHYSNAPKIPIISYVTYNKHENLYIYYAWKDGWEDRVEHRTWQTEVMPNVEVSMDVDTRSVFNHRLLRYMRKKIIITKDLQKTLDTLPKNIEILQIKDVLKTQRFKNYPKEAMLVMKLFGNETDMHKTFLRDFSICEYDGIMTFNGRGGNRNLGGQRKWFNGFDMPMFFERCKFLGLEKELQQLSPFPYSVSWGGRIYNAPVRVRSMYNDAGIETKHEIYIKGVVQYDLYFDQVLLEYTKYEYKMQRRNLDTFMQYFIGIGKIPHEGSVWELFQKDWEKEMYYNIVDVEGMFALDTYFDYINDISGRALLYGGKIEDSLYASKLHDHINLWFSNDKYVMDSKVYDSGLREILRPNRWRGWIPPNDKTFNTRPGGKVGGFNLEAVTGVHGIGAIYDFSKLYPSCYITSNIDVRTKINADYIERNNDGIFIVDKDGVKWNQKDLARTPAGFFRKDILAQNSIIYKELITQRNIFSKISDDFLEKYTNEINIQLKQDYLSLYNSYNARQFSYKVLINGKFGADGNEGTRTFDYCIYNSSPSMGQDLIRFVIEWLKQRGYISLFASTDSAMTTVKSTTPEGAWNESQAIVKELNKDIKRYVFWKFNPYDYVIDLGVEKIFDRFILFDKRRYIMNTVIVGGKNGMLKLKSPKKFIKGIEIVRGDSALITKEIQEDMIDILTEGSKEDLYNYIRNIDDEFRSYPWAYITSRASISNDINAGDSSNAHYNACRNANRLFNKSYDAGVRPLLGYFDVHPRNVNGEYISGGELTMAFDEVDEYPLKKLGFDLNYQRIKEATVIKKIMPFVNILDKKMRYEDVINKYKRAEALTR